MVLGKIRPLIKLRNLRQIIKMWEWEENKIFIAWVLGHLHRERPDWKMRGHKGAWELLHKSREKLKKVDCRPGEEFWGIVCWVTKLDAGQGFQFGAVFICNSNSFGGVVWKKEQLKWLIGKRKKINGGWWVWTVPLKCFVWVWLGAWDRGQDIIFVRKEIYYWATAQSWEVSPYYTGVEKCLSVYGDVWSVQTTLWK